MKPRCLTSIRMSMTATLLHQNDDYVPGYPDLSEYGEWQNSQDPLTGEIVRSWIPFDNPSTPTVDESVTLDTIPCIARSIVDGGIRVAGTTERFGGNYENIDFVFMWVPSNVVVTKRDRITNITDKNGHITWIDEEFSDPLGTGTPRATVFNVNGVSPLFNAWNELVEWRLLLERASVDAPE